MALTRHTRQNYEIKCRLRSAPSDRVVLYPIFLFKLSPRYKKRGVTKTFLVTPSLIKCIALYSAFPLQFCKIVGRGLGNRRHKDFLEILLTCTGRNRVTADDILLQTFEVVDTAADCSFAEHLGGFLEGSG